MQVRVELHLGVWYLVPFRGVRVDRTWEGTWLCVTIRASR